MKIADLKCAECLRLSSTKPRTVRQCRPCRLERRKRWRKKNWKKILEYQRAYCARNPEKMRERRAAYYRKNRERVIARNRVYYFANLERCKARGVVNSRRWKRLHRDQVLATQRAIRARKMAAGLCIYCSDPLKESGKGYPSVCMRCSCRKRNTARKRHNRKPSWMKGVCGAKIKFSCPYHRGGR